MRQVFEALAETRAEEKMLQLYRIMNGGYKTR